MKKDIILENKSYKVVSYKEGNEPANVVITQPGHNSSRRCSMPNGVDAVWQNPYNFNAPDNIKFNYKKVTLEERSVGSKVSLCDLMNHYYNLSTSELDSMREDVQTAKVSELDLEVEKLKKTRKELEESMKKFNLEFEKFRTETAGILEGKEKL